MKQISNKSPKIASLILILASAAMSCASAAPESHIYSPEQIHHYGSNQGASTVTVVVPSHYSFKSGQYVLIPTRSAEAPLPLDEYSAAYWVSGSGTESGHWGVQK